MTDTPSLVDFLRARLDEDEQVAREGARYPGTRWTSHHHPDKAPIVMDEDGANVVVWPEIEDSAGVVAHIARHDPARVLADVAAKRILVSFLDPSGAPEGEGKYLAERALVLLAAPFSHHPDYRPEWVPRPDA